MTAPATNRPCNKAEAKALTERIRQGVDALWKLLLEAHERKAWKALGYETWEAYVKAEFNMSRSRSYQLLDHARLIAENPDLSTIVDMPEGKTREIKRNLPEMKARVGAGEKAEDVAADLVAKAAARRAERAAEQAEHDRQREEMRAKLPDSVKRGEEAKAKNGSVHAAVARGLTPQDRIAELEEAVRTLEARNAELEDRDKRYSDLAVLYEKGGFDAVVAAKDEEIRVLKTRVERESHDKVSYMRSAESWKAKAIKLGYSSDLEIPLESAHG